MQGPEKNSYKEFDNEKKFLQLENSPTEVFCSCSFIPRPHFLEKFIDGRFLWLRDMTS